MESEEFEQIPWANLVADRTDGIDKRVYLAVGVVGLLIVAVFGARLLGGGSQPMPPPHAVAPMSTSTVREAEPAVAPPTSMVVAEADLMAEVPIGAGADNRLVEATAEWFVTDWFTRDGSDETIRSIKAALAPGVISGPLPHDSQDEPVTFVEWAKAIETDVLQDGLINVTVMYRAIRETGEGFVRDPVRTALISLQREGSAVFVTVLPSES